VKHERVVCTAETDFPDHYSPALPDDAGDVGVDGVFGFVSDVSDLVDEFCDNVMLFALPFGVLQEDIHEPELALQRHAGEKFGFLHQQPAQFAYEELQNLIRHFSALNNLDCKCTKESTLLQLTALSTSLASYINTKVNALHSLHSQHFPGNNPTLIKL